MIDVNILIQDTVCVSQSRKTYFKQSIPESLKMIDLLALPDCHDIAWGWIQTLFGTNGKCTNIVGAADVNTPYANAFAVLTASLAFFGGLFMAYHTVAGIVHSAYSGKVLGERWHQIWAPLRVVFGFGLLIPVGDGFSSVHYILRDGVGVAAINLANNLIGAYLGTALKDGVSSTNSKVSSLSGRDYAQKFFEKEVCAGVIGAMPSGMFTWYHYNAASPEKPASSWVWDSMTKNGQIWDYGSCGRLSLEAYEPGANDGIFSTGSAREAIAEFNKARAEATEELRQTIRAEGFMDYAGTGKFINENGDSIKAGDDAVIADLRSKATVPPAIQVKLNEASDAWDKKISQAATQIFLDLTKDKRSNLVEQVKYSGFMAAGAMERSLSAISGTVSGLANDQMASTSPAVDPATKKKLEFAQSLITASKAVDTKDADAGGADDTSNLINSAVSSLMPKNIDNMFTGKASADPIGDMIMFGNNVLTAASYALLLMWGAKAVADGFGNSLAGLFGGGAASSIADSISRWFSWFIMIMIIVGLMHSFVLPLLPMIMVFTMGVQWLIMFLEGSIAAVLWAFVFIRMDGTEFFDQKQSPGAGLLFNLLLRPALGMLAFCGMLLLLPALLNTLNLVWSGAFYMSTGEHLEAGTTMGVVKNGLGLVWLWQWLASMVMFCWMQWTMTLRITGLIPSIADRVGHWMGISSTAGYGDSAETHQNVAALIASTQALHKMPIMGGGQQQGGGQGGRGSSPKPPVKPTAAQGLGNNGMPKKKK
ncbi:DotA/TraY family protein [Rhizobium sp. BK176]|uniref:DotA/TraY family protein n=1 Tax=Rhizobium sp. BK176 TaxID=2587071 RepID=UPI002168C704|nr:DotA/TraY family protein [Rhizobium sp. BK176]MCS4089539.1 conjugal transfer/type IV secretion protein DotA/TraY [Rhizobium sp. BK176]